MMLLSGLFVCLASLVLRAESTCVLESDFGFTINCAFKKSGLFRVRNLGGIKAHVGLGFSVGDELGFGQSLTNLDPSRRRSVSIKSGLPPNAIPEPAAVAPSKQEKRGKQNRLVVRQPSPNSPAHAAGSTNMPKMTDIQAAMANLHRRGQAPTTMQPIVVPSGPTVDIPNIRTNTVPKLTIAKPLPMSVPPFRPLPPKFDSTLSVLPISSTRRTPQISQAKGPGLAFTNPEPHRIADHASQLYPVYSQNPTKKLDDYNSITGYGDDSQYGLTKGDLNEKISEIAKAGNISMEAVEAAIVLRQQQLLNQYANIPIPSTSAPTSTSTTELPVYQPEPEFSVTPKQKRYPMASGSAKVMNAPREYYPVGYEKNFDDKFESKVELPETSFYCGDQKYFPGLYADENLGCMVFHVCALTDEGLVMKSFLCPESTLFDQTILKCNWWFYVDCKNSRQLYDTNIPVSKSYQLMKALTFFSSYKKDNLDDGGRAKNPEDIEGIKEAIAILENQDTSKSPVGQTEAVAVQAPPPPATAARHKTIHLSSGKYNGTIANHRMDRQYEANITRDRPITALDNLPDSDASNSDNHPATVSHNTRTTQSVSVEVTSDESVSSSKERRPRRKQNIYSQRRTQATITTTGKPNAQPTTHEPKILVTSTKAVDTSTLKPGDLVVNSQKAEDHSDNKNEENNMTEQLNVNNTNIGTETVEEIKETGKETVANEVLMANKEKVQIVRPTPFSELVGQFATPTATMAALDEAVLGLAATEGHREPRPNLPSETTVKRERQDST